MVDTRGPTERTGSDAPPRRRAGSVIPIALGLFVLGLIVALVLAFLLWRDDDVATSPESTTVSAVAENPQAYVGETVIVSGEVSEVLTPFAYVIGGERFVGGDELLVVGSPPAATTGDVNEQEVFADDIVQISGEVREFNRAELEEEWGAEFSADVFEGYEGQPVLVGESISLTSRVQAPDGDIVEADDIVNNPEDHIGESVAVDDEITHVYSDRVFVLGDGLLVVDETGVVAETALTEGGQVQASGEVREFNQADFADVDVSQFEGNPVLYAEVIQVLE